MNSEDEPKWPRLMKIIMMGNKLVCNDIECRYRLMTADHRQLIPSNIHNNTYLSCSIHLSTKLVLVDMM